MNILEEALKVTEERQKSYDKPEDNFQRIADYWSVYFKSTGRDLTITQQDVALMMILMKVARIQWKYSTDSAVDIAGYAHCLARIESSSKHNKNGNPHSSTSTFDDKPA